MCTPQRPLRVTVFLHLPGGAGFGVAGSDPPEPGYLPKVKAAQVPPGWAAARLRLRCAFALHQDHPGDASGHLENGRRLRTSSDRAGRGGGSTCCRSPSLSGPASRCRRRAIAGTGRGRQWRDADEPERQVPGGSPASVSRGAGGNSRTSKGLRGPGQAPGGAGGLCRGPSEETHRVGGLGGWSGAAGGGQSSGTTPRCRPME